MSTSTAADAVLAQVRSRVLSFASRRVSRDAAEDVAQETLLLLATKYGHLGEAADLVPLALRIARLKVLNLWRKNKRAPVSVEESPQEPASGEDAEDDYLRRMLFGDLLKALETLSERCRQLLAFRLEGRDFEEIQRLMSAASINTVYTWDNRCRKNLRETLGWARG